MAEGCSNDSEACAALPGSSWADDRIPDETRPSSNFRHLLERHELTEADLAGVNAILPTGASVAIGPTLVMPTIIECAVFDQEQVQGA